MSGSSILVRNNDKYVLRAWSHMSRNIPASFATEGLACLEAVLFPSDMVFQHVVVESDSQSIISKLGKMKLDESKVILKVVDLNSFRDRGIKVAHTLAKESFGQGGSSFWVEEAQSSVAAILDQDRWCLTPQHRNQGTKISKSFLFLIAKTTCLADPTPTIKITNPHHCPSLLPSLSLLTLPPSHHRSVILKVVDLNSFRDRGIKVAHTLAKESFGQGGSSLWVEEAQSSVAAILDQDRWCLTPQHRN
ncbi:hypothetical protein PVK06_025168 [Gossypium arboreum]|uniref:RNase H type-1 domain-containing protein n=1 Tax=Gossypium arboreum TaxID=29729 RepID=A0ABR0PG44_GOSAR|nr:hypothetical protein PVK06_025168 [Gossypium arboreum]